MVNAVREREVWRQYLDYDFIEASNLGRIRIKDRVVKGGNGSKRSYNGHVLKQWLDRNGYLFVNFRVNGKTVNLKVHRIVAICFLPNPDNLPEVNHRDNNPKNNSVENLEWCDHKYNIAYREKYGTAQNRPVFVVNLKTLEVSRFKSQGEAARQLGVCSPNVNDVLKGRRKQTGGYWFCNADENAVENIRVKFGDKIAKKVEELMRNGL